MTERRYALQAEQPRRVWWWLLSLGLVAGGVYALQPPSSASVQRQMGDRLQEAQARLQSLQQEQQALALALKHEKVTRETLEKEFAEQAEELKRVRRDLAFYRSNSSAPPAAAAGR
ncbi:MAG: hypothetical protein CGU28_13330 [Candidatus Dactylopiibacterium carminicum]|uniref:Uncharacterized protein n=1 Tax=Candidatus Dactylopiibacterium carminicum TaxID=857335 RepID=A0A272EP64_9RHOO|nr:hypothetical protein BGI27_14390 [Candidatus Dactylopiibacterium carminicum]PAS91894.1 MAG: hypothetical protein CGU29_14020 [Candidatus Dactylopiibacterium carminicum]PAS94870.1 MAG: hypothetical protein CGU28_13330 [Candidatus Dactylopiibacterium carminicum]PAS97083.1 MAG: hypothetical protein BSR46_14425 [Candidatus Dactylopiibacterium carminicum]